jgi:hypothetical protein
MTERCAILALALLAGCKADLGQLESVEVREAWVEDAKLQSVALFGGGAWGRGTLVVHGQQGEWLEVPVTLRGGMLGLVFDFTREEPELRLELPDDPITADMLLGGYRGSGEEVVIGVGLEVRHLHNQHGVGIDQADLAVGVGVMFAYEWLRIRVSGDPLEAEDTGWSGGDL